jgi:hypothetical protein
MSSSKRSYIVMSTDFRPIIWGRRSSSTYSRLTQAAVVPVRPSRAHRPHRIEPRRLFLLGRDPDLTDGGGLARWHGRHGTQVNGDWRALGGQLGQYVPNQIRCSELCLLGRGRPGGARRSQPTGSVLGRVEGDDGVRGRACEEQAINVG